MPTKDRPISEVVREALARAIERESQAELARRSGVDAAVLYRFVEGGELRSNNLDRIADALNVVAVQRPAKKGRQR